MYTALWVFELCIIWIVHSKTIYVVCSTHLPRLSMVPGKLFYRMALRRTLADSEQKTAKKVIKSLKNFLNIPVQHYPSVLHSFVGSWQSKHNYFWLNYCWTKHFRIIILNYLELNSLYCTPTTNKADSDSKMKTWKNKCAKCLNWSNQTVESKL